MRLLRRKIKKTDANGRIELERVIGLTVTNASGLATNAATGEVAYIAGCVVVIYNPKTNTQSRFLIANRTPKAVSCVAYSYHGGKLVAAGESGHQPAVIIWDSISGQCMIELKTHKIGISCVEFSPNGRHIVSVGVPHDGFLCLWEWRSGTLLSKTRTSTVSSPVSSVHYASDGSFFITAGIKHLRQWSVVQGGRARPTAANGSTLEGKAINLGSQKDGSFVSISSSKDPAAQSANIHPIYVLTNAGILCLLHLGIAVEKWVDLKVRRGFDLAVSETHVACACSDGIVRLFALGTLAYAATLPRPAPYGYHGLTDSNMCTALSVGRVHGINFPDAVACSFIASGDRIAVVYGDHSLYVWDVRDFSKFHALKSNAGKENVVGGECFATCSADGSIRLWNVGPDKDVSQAVASKSANVYCKDILGVLYTDVKDILRPSEQDVDSQDSSQGFRAISVSADGKYLASGDRSGNLRVYDLMTFEMVSFQEAHDAEILSLSFSAGFQTRSEEQMPLLASGGRDRLVHMYDVNRNFEVIETLDDHSASITGVKFACGGTRLLSCSADKSVVFRHIESKDGCTRSSRYHQEVALRGTIYDMDLHPNEKFVVTAEQLLQDKKVNILNLTTGKPVRNIKPESDFGEPIKVRVDPSGTFVLCSHSDKCIRLYDFASGELLTHASGHAEVITGMSWLPDCKHLISVSGDSCIFIWKLPPIMSRTMRRKLISQAEAQPPPRYLKSALKRSQIGRLRTSKTSLIRLSLVDSAQENPALATNEEPSFKFSVSKLPSWAQSKVEEENSESSKRTNADNPEENAQSAESRWVERVGNHGYKLATEAGEETPPATIHVSGFGARRRFSVENSVTNQDSTPESSLNSQTDGSPMSSPRDPPRKETQWKTVHTVFFDEMDFLPDTGHGDEAAHHFGSRVITTTFASSAEEQEDGLVVCLPEYEGPKCGGLGTFEETVMSTPRKDGGNHALDNGKNAGDQIVGIDSGRDEVKNCSSSPMDCNVSPGDDTDGWDENSSPRRDLFSAHFDKLTSAAKANSSTRSSLSARFFARTTRTPIVQNQDALLEDDDVTSNPGCLLAAERERLKLQERQDKMASEVQRMRERLVNLGMAVCEGGKAEKRPLEDTTNQSTPTKHFSSNNYEPEETTQPDDYKMRPLDAPKRPMVEAEDVSCGTASTIESAPSSPGNLADMCTSPQKMMEAVPAFGGCLPRPKCEYVAALEDLERAAERATSLFSELQEFPVDNFGVSNLDLAARLTQSYQSVLPDALQKIQNLANQLSTRGILTATSERAADTPTSDNGLLSRPNTAASLGASDVARSSVDIEGLLERYSTRFSENLAHQVLALVQKGLGTETKPQRLQEVHSRFDMGPHFSPQQRKTNERLVEKLLSEITNVKDIPE
ncbi:hypothetical protein SELMODRAFT_404876 [Selaginella moellendorffii]|uniref:MABP1/WDR62 second WD40 domain-containing protein n=1 Tax=Selaginella moellendorffii TaxID=88036 RepID=D8QXM8_SELML|nr:hypothetical protein SELMODRAFT_404876 [Selaginella moellendorffii]